MIKMKDMLLRDKTAHLVKPVSVPFLLNRPNNPETQAIRKDLGLKVHVVQPIGLKSITRGKRIYVR
jgi:hypothetical protein